jgi:urease accessory protein
MLHITERLSGVHEFAATLTLPFDLRQRTRQRLRLDDGREAALLLPRGMVLRGGDRLRASGGEVIAVKAAAEEVSTLFGNDSVQLARAAYHLGNRHIAVQLGDGWLRFLRDHVLDSMVRDLGIQLIHDVAPFEPEAGAYHRHE